MNTGKNMSMHYASVSSFLLLTVTAVPTFAGTAVLGGDATLTGATGATLAQNTGNYAQFTSSGGASAVLDWSSFNVGAGKEMNFSGAGTTFFNLVDAAASKSQIDGIISGNGSVWVINPNGIAFGASSQVNVGGLFAAAAGNISNADDLRSGAATLPAFSSFGGIVSSDAGATFSAGQVAFMGRAASVAGDMTGVDNVNVGVADKMVVDKVGGGVVRIGVMDAAFGSQNISAYLGDLDVGGKLDVLVERSAAIVGNVTADETALTVGGSAIVQGLSSGSVNVQALGGDVYLGNVEATKGNIVASSAIGNVIVAEGGVVRTTAKGAGISLASSTQGAYQVGGNTYPTDGDVIVEGTVAAEGEGGDVFLNARGLVYRAADGSRAASTGDVFVYGSVSADGDVEVESVGGDIGIGGNVSGGSLVEMRTGHGDIAFGCRSKVTAGKVATETTPETSGMVSVLAGMYGNGAGDVNVLSAVDPGSGNEYKGEITALGERGKVQMCAGFAGGSSGSVTVDGRVAAAGANGEVNISAGYGNGAGTVGDVTVSGEVMAGKNAKLNVYEGAMVVSEGGVVRTTADGAEVLLRGGMKANAVSDIQIDGTVKAEGSSSKVLVNHGYAANASGTVTVGEKGKVQATGSGGTAQVGTGVGSGAWGDVVVDGEVSAAGNVVIEAGNGGLDAEGRAIGTRGSLTIASHANISGGGKIVKLATYEGDLTVEKGATIRSTGTGGEVVLRAGDKVDGRGNISVSGLLESTGNAALDDNGNVVGGVSLLAGLQNGSTGDITLTKDGEVVVSGERGKVQICAGFAEGAPGNVTMDGRVVAEGANGEVNISAGYGNDAGSVGDVTVGGEVVASKNVKLNVYEGTLRVSEGGVLRTTSDGSETLLRGGMKANAVSNIQIDGTVRAEGSSSKVLVNHGYAANASGTVTVGEKGKVQATGSGGTTQVGTGIGGGIGAWGDVVVDGEVSAAGNVVIEAGNGGSDAEGRAIGTRGSLTIASHANISGGGRIVKLATYEGDLTVEKGATVQSTGVGEGLVLRAGDKVNGSGDINVSGLLKSTGDAVIDGDGKSVGGLSLITGGRRGSTGNITLTKDGMIEASGRGVRVQVASGVEDAREEHLQGGNVDIEGTIRSTGENSKVYVWGGHGDYTEGDVSVSGEILNEGDSGEIKIWSARGDHSTGNLSIDGTVWASGAGGNVYLFSAYGDYATGSMTIDGLAAVSGEGGRLFLESAVGKGADGDLTLNGYAAAEGDYTGITLGSGIGEGAKGNVKITGAVLAEGRGVSTYIQSGHGDESKGSIDLPGTVAVRGDGAYIEIGASVGKSAQGTVDISGTVAADGRNSQARAYAAYGDGASGRISVPGNVTSAGDGSATLLVVGYGTDANGSVDVKGTVAARGRESNVAIIGGYGTGASGSVSVGGNMAATKDAQIRVSGGHVVVNGNMTAGNVASVVASGGSISFGDTGVVTAGSTANVLADGDISQRGNAIEVNGGVAGVQDVSAAVKADTINLKAGGSIGGDSGYLGVEGKVRAVAGGDAYLAAASGTDFRGGDLSGAPSSVSVSGFERSVGSIDENGLVRENKIIVDGIDANFGALGGTSAIVAGGNLAIYTSGKLEANGFLKAAGDIIVSASDLGDVSYLQADGTLTVNNVGKPSNPKIAYFESVDGKEPKINNLPNDTVIFIDGRLAGGNLKILNQFGADEAFMVETPELKSTQGIFGSPTFLHGDLDVANPLAVGAIDYMLQETPRLTLDKAFPKEADQHVDSVVIPERDSIQFGRVAKDEEKPKADGKVAQAR